MADQQPGWTDIYTRHTSTAGVDEKDAADLNDPTCGDVSHDRELGK